MKNPSEISLCVKENKLGWIVEPNKPKLLSEMFESIYNEYNKNGGFDINNTREIVLNKFSKDFILSQIDVLFR